MKISTKGRYALEAVLDLALNSKDRHESLKEVSERRSISETYLEQIFVKLKKNGIVSSVRGAQGGYRVDRPFDEITVGEIVRAVEGPLAPVKCTVDKAAPVECDIYDRCVTKDFWMKVADEINDTLDAVTLKTLIDYINEMKSSVVYDYFI
jgi:Rrf2 family transcriptional regulator, cysteine metabolism repressor